MLTLYVKDGCPYCAAAKKHYTEEGREFVEKNVHSTPGALDEMKKVSGGRMAVPVIVDGDEVTVGFGGS